MWNKNRINFFILSRVNYRIYVSPFHCSIVFTTIINPVFVIVQMGVVVKRVVIGDTVTDMSPVWWHSDCDCSGESCGGIGLDNKNCWWWYLLLLTSHLCDHTTVLSITYGFKSTTEYSFYNRIIIQCDSQYFSVKYSKRVILHLIWLLSLLSQAAWDHSAARTCRKVKQCKEIFRKVSYCNKNICFYSYM